MVLTIHSCVIFFTNYYLKKTPICGCNKTHQLQSNFYKLNDHYPEKNPVKEVKSDRLSLQDAVALLQLIDDSSNRSSNYGSLTVWTFTHIHTYIIGHYNPSVRIIDLVSHTTYVVCVNFIHKWRDLQFKVDSERQIFWETFYGNFIYSQEFLPKICWE